MIRFYRDYAFEHSNERDAVISSAFAQVVREHESKEIGYYALPQVSLALVDEVKAYMSAHPLFSQSKIKDIAVIGIGGSSLGIKAVNSMMASKHVHSANLHFFENSDPIDIYRTLEKLKKEETMFIVISKSGSTVETTSIFKTVLDHYALDIDGADKEQVLVITDKGSSLSQFADFHGIKQFNIYENVGGRFSVLSAVGIVPLTMAGFDTTALLKGAGNLLDRFFDRKEDHILEKACHLVENGTAQSINVLFAYANDLENLCKWYVQLWGESLGKLNKNGKSVGFTPIGLIGSIDQHSFLQLLIEGPKDKTVTFMSVENFEKDLVIPNISLKHIEKTDFVNQTSYNKLINAQCDATRESLIQSGLTVDQIVLETIHEENIGKVMIYYELLTSLVGSMLDVNTYDQPGVELGKTILFEKFKK